RRRRGRNRKSRRCRLWQRCRAHARYRRQRRHRRRDARRDQSTGQNQLTRKDFGSAHMKITDVRAHHIRIPYDAGVASFKQGPSAISALDFVIVEVSTDAGMTGWGDAFAYVCPETVATAVTEMIVPQARGFDVPDAAGIPAFMERIQRNLHL